MAVPRSELALGAINSESGVRVELGAGALIPAVTEVSSQRCRSRRGKGCRRPRSVSPVGGGATSEEVAPRGVTS
jgi:hypothetical protein